jgi:hypothetical protein
MCLKFSCLQYILNAGIIIVEYLFIYVVCRLQASYILKLVNERK